MVPPGWLHPKGARGGCCHRGGEPLPYRMPRRSRVAVVVGRISGLPVRVPPALVRENSPGVSRMGRIGTPTMAIRSTRITLLVSCSASQLLRANRRTRRSRAPRHAYPFRSPDLSITWPVLSSSRWPQAGVHRAGFAGLLARRRRPSKACLRLRIPVGLHPPKWTTTGNDAWFRDGKPPFSLETDRRQENTRETLERAPDAR